ncbi:serpin B8 [Folsomia candida]|uniref:serpin B8 n=1 Tax=Folsomia candida TaxID=158441 RepID=UPI000B8FA68A|nr:serpin B8 [Folsomia candida]
MWKRLGFGTILIFGSICQLATSQNLDFISREGQAVAEATKNFPSKIYSATNEESGGNFVISPISIGSVLSMLREGANGATRKELNEAMEFQSLSENAISNGYHDILYSLHENKGSIVRIANRIYITNSGNIKPAFTDILQSKYLTKVLPTNFLRNQEVSDDINRWVDETTNGKITNLISSDDIDSNTKAIVANAIYFKGKWINQFNIRGTRNQLFYSDDGNSTEASFMEQEDVFPHVDLPELTASAIAMPYEGDRFNLIVILPHDGVKLAEVEEKLQPSSFTDIPPKMSKKSIQIVFPKFKMESQVDFTKLGILRKLGLADAITPGKADFSLITTEQRIHIDTVIQKCYIDITEQGTEAAGATYAKIVPFSFRRSIPFKVTKPFIAYIYDSVTKTILFTMRKSTI